MKIITLSGKSASGKDLLYRKLLEKHKELKPVVTHTTRPMRSKETDGWGSSASKRGESGTETEAGSLSGAKL